MGETLFDPNKISWSRRKYDGGYNLSTDGKVARRFVSDYISSVDLPAHSMEYYGVVTPAYSADGLIFFLICKIPVRD